MASLLDGTLVVQVMHFIVAYLILSKLFLKPVYQQLRELTIQKKDLNNAISTLQQELIEQRDTATHILTTTQQEIIQSLANPTPAPLINVSQDEKPVVEKISKKAHKELIDQIVQHLKKRVLND